MSRIKKYKLVWINIEDCQMPIIGRVVKKQADNNLLVQIRCAAEGKWSEVISAYRDKNNRVQLVQKRQLDPIFMKKLYPRWHCKFCDRWNYNKNLKCKKCNRSRVSCDSYEAFK